MSLLDFSKLVDNFLKLVIFQFLRLWKYLTTYKPPKKDYFLTQGLEPVRDELQLDVTPHSEGEIPKDISGSKNSLHSLKSLHQKRIKLLL
jgi:hypothetical protein